MLDVAWRGCITSRIKWRVHAVAVFGGEKAGKVVGKMEKWHEANSAHRASINIIPDCPVTLIGIITDGITAHSGSSQQTLSPA